MSKSKIRQKDKEGYTEGFRTGFTKGYEQGMEDAVAVVVDLLEDNGVHMDESEFFIQLETLKEEGTIKDVTDYL